MFINMSTDKSYHKIISYLFLLSYCSLIAAKGITQSSPTVHTVSQDGAWCWFSDPRAIYFKHQGMRKILSGWVTKVGDIEVGLLNPTNGQTQSMTLADQFEIDDHDNPAFTQVNNKNVLALYTRHGDGDVYIHQWNPKAEFTKFNQLLAYQPIDSLEFKKFPLKNVTYANPYRLKKENNRVYCFGRWTGYKPNITWSDDGGQTFKKSKVLISTDPFDPGNRPYVKYFSDGKSAIHMVFTTGHPRNEPLNSVYYAKYEDGAFWKVDGSKICNFNELPFAPNQASVVYSASVEEGRAWIYDLVADKKGWPTIAYARYPAENDHRYHYATFDGHKWIDHEICKAGKWFPQTKDGNKEPEPHYSAGLTIHPIQSETIYLSREINGIFELEKRTTSDNGLTWKIKPITRNSKFDQVRPFVPRNMRKKDPAIVLWMENKSYIHYTDYDSQIKYWIDTQ